MSLPNNFRRAPNLNKTVSHMPVSRSSLVLPFRIKYLSSRKQHDSQHAKLCVSHLISRWPTLSVAVRATVVPCQALGSTPLDLLVDVVTVLSKTLYLSSKEATGLSPQDHHRQWEAVSSGQFFSRTLPPSTRSRSPTPPFASLHKRAGVGVPTASSSSHEHIF